MKDDAASLKAEDLVSVGRVTWLSPHCKAEESGVWCLQVIAAAKMVPAQRVWGWECASFLLLHFVPPGSPGWMSHPYSEQVTTCQSSPGTLPEEWFTNFLGFSQSSNADEPDYPAQMYRYQHKWATGTDTHGRWRYLQPINLENCLELMINIKNSTLWTHISIARYMELHT